MPLERVLGANELWEGEMRSVVVGGEAILLLRLPTGVFAYADRCPHKGVPLGLGQLEGEVITCCAHHWQFDACTGRGINPQGVQLRAYHVRELADGIFIEY